MAPIGLAHRKRGSQLTVLGSSSPGCWSKMSHNSLCDLGQVTGPLDLVSPSRTPLMALPGLIVSYSFLMPARKARLITKYEALIVCCAPTKCSLLYPGRLAEELYQ